MPAFQKGLQSLREPFHMGMEPGWQLRRPSSFLLCKFPAHGKKDPVDLTDLLIRLRRSFLQDFPLLQEFLFGKLRGVHIPGPLHQVMGFIHQQHIVPAGIKVAPQISPGIKCIVIVADNTVHPEGNVQLIFKRADAVFFGILYHRLPGDIPLLSQQIQNGLIDPVVMAAGKIAFLRITGNIGTQAYFLLCRQRNPPENQPPFLHNPDCLLRRLPGYRFGRQIKNLLSHSFSHSLYRRIQGGNGLACPGGRLGKQQLLIPNGPVHAHSQFPLAPAVMGKGKRERPCGAVPLALILQ